MASFHEKDPFAIPGTVPGRDLTESFPPESPPGDSREDPGDNDRDDE